MYTDCIYTAYASTENYVSAPKYKPIQCSEPINSDFQKYIACVIEQESSYQTYPVKSPYQTYPVASPYQTYPVQTYPVASPYQTYPVASVQASKTTGVFDIGNYYPISESEVVQGIRAIRQVINNADLSAKTDVETYDWIEQRFIEAFGNDFMMARNLNLPSSWFYMIGIEFTDTLSRHIEDPAQTNRTRLFGDASTDEIQNSIRERFPEVLTNRDLFLMVNEMRNSGVLDSATMRVTGADGTDRFFDTLDLLRSYARLSTQNSSSEFESLSVEDQDRRWNGILNNQITFLDLLRLFNAWATNSMVVMGNDVSPFLVNFLGGVKNSDGLFVVNSNNGGTKENTYENGYEDYAGYEGGGPVMAAFVGPYGGEYGYEYGNGYENEYNDDNEEKDWNNVLNMMMREIDEYNELIRSRMQIINGEEYIVSEDANEQYNGEETPYSPGYESPSYESPDYESPGYESPGYENPGYENPGYESPGYESPGYENP